MEARSIRDPAELVPGRFNIPEPPETAPVLFPETLEFILVPGLSFDGAGRRLGRGGGFYDRYLSQTCAFTAAIVRERLLLPEVPAESHDVRVDCLITETRILRA